MRTGKERVPAVIVATALLAITATWMGTRSSGAGPRESISPPVATPPTSSFSGDLPPGSWTRTFDDEFDATSLDTAKWGTRYPWGSQVNTGTHETQCYEPGALSEGSGVLTITATRERVTCDGRGQVTEPYVSGMIQSRPSYTFTYGYSVIRAKLPGETGTWPAFWQLPADYSWPPEFAVLESWGQHGARGNLYRVTEDYTSQGPRGQTASGQVQRAVNEVTGEDFTSRWHTYGVDWEPGSVTYFIDGVATARYVTDVPSKPMYVLANLAMQSGSAISGPSSATMSIDYIRVYQRS